MLRADVPKVHRRRGWDRGTKFSGIPLKPQSFKKQVLRLRSERLEWGSWPGLRIYSTGLALPLLSDWSMMLLIFS